MKKNNVLIVGASGHSKIIIDIFEKEKKYKIIGLLDTFKKKGEKILGHTIIGSEENLSDLLLKNPNCKIFIAVGDNWTRQTVAKKIIKIAPTIDFATAIHPSAQIGKNAKIGKGAAIMAGSIIGSETSIGDFTIINTKASIDHDSEMLKFSSLGPNATIGGNVSIGKFSAISIGATLKNGVSIGNHSVIGAGALLLKNCGNNQIMYGAPAKEIRKHEVGEKYL